MEMIKVFYYSIYSFKNKIINIYNSKMALNGQTSSLRGVHCKLDNITGVKSLVTTKGVDIVDIAENFSTQLDKFNSVLSDLSHRISRLEKNNNSPQENGPLLMSISDRLKKFEELLDGDELRGRTGPQGPKGEAGPRGPKVENLHDVKDVVVDGVTDGSILVRRGNVWKAELLE